MTWKIVDADSPKITVLVTADKYFTGHARCLFEKPQRSGTNPNKAIHSQLKRANHKTITTFKKGRIFSPTFIEFYCCCC